MTRAQNQAEGGGGEGAQGKALEHFVNGDEEPAEAETNDHSLLRVRDEVRPDLGDGVAGGDAQAQEQDSNDPKRSHNSFVANTLNHPVAARRTRPPPPSGMLNGLEDKASLNETLSRAGTAG